MRMIFSMWIRFQTPPQGRLIRVVKYSSVMLTVPALAPVGDLPECDAGACRSCRLPERQAGPRAYVEALPPNICTLGKEAEHMGELNV